MKVIKLTNLKQLLYYELSDVTIYLKTPPGDVFLRVGRGDNTSLLQNLQHSIHE